MIAGWKSGCAFVLGMSITFMAAGFSIAEDDPEQGVKKYGIVHNIAGDREVIKVGGRYEPEGLDYYMKRKFDEVSSQIHELQNNMLKLSEQIQQLNSKIDSVLNKNAQ